MGSRAALIVGINHYTSPAIDDLRSAVSDAERVAAAPAVTMSLHTLRQGLEAEPRFFRWEPVAGAASYVFIVRDDDPGGDVLIIRSVSDPVLITTDVESANLTTGKFLWSLEARRANGTRVGYGEGSFTID